MPPALARLRPHLPAFLLGLSITLTLSGYQFGSGNHTVYLIAPLQKLHPDLLANDWWTTHTLQYHLAFTHLTTFLMRLNIECPAFFILYLALAILLHLAWLRIALTLGLDAKTYLLSVLLYHLGAGGVSLGSYQFLQDASLLPGNIANIAMLWALYFFIANRTLPAAACFAIASFFHLNHAIVAILFWFTAPLFIRTIGNRQWAIGITMIFALALPNLIPTVRAALSTTTKLPLPQFVDVYVHLRHPHHYDPLAWPIALWLSFLLPIPLALLAHRRRLFSAFTVHRSAFAFSFFLTLSLIALLFAGVFFISEPLIQLSLFRFSIYVKLLSCLGAAAFLLNPARRFLPAIPAFLIGVLLIAHTNPFIAANLTPLLLFTAATFLTSLYLTIDRPPFLPSLLVTFALCLLTCTFVPKLGLRLPTQDADDHDYLALCHYARDHTPTDALFLVPPHEQLFRYHAQRAIVINFKNVPQLSSEIPEWRNRLETILAMPLSKLPRRFDQTHAALAARYDALPPAHLLAVAQRYDARYLVTTRPLPGLTPVFENARYHLYDLAHIALAAAATTGRTQPEGDPRGRTSPPVALVHAAQPSHR